jgi:hypothetical protein
MATSKGEGVFTGMFIGFLFSSAMIVGSAFLGSLNPPVPTPAKSGQERQEHRSSENQIGTADERPAQSDTTAIPQRQPKLDAQPDHENRHTSDNESPSKWRDPITWFTLVLAVAAVIQIGVYIAQACYMRDGLRHAQATVDEMRLERRAWLSFETPELSELAAGSACTIAMPVKNTGKTPGVIIKQLFHICTDLAGIGSGIAEMEAFVHGARRSQTIEVVVAPDARSVFNATDGSPTTPSTVDGISRGTLYLLVGAYIEYKDAAGGLHETIGCFRYNYEKKALWAHGKIAKMT